MNRHVVVIFIFACFFLHVKSQSLTEAEVTAKMYQAFELNKAKKTANALEAFLIVGNNTELQRTEAERQVFVCSQTMACMCYGRLKQYQEAYMLAKKLMQGNLNDKEKKDVGYQYAINGYWYAITFLKKDLVEFADYKKGRDILEKVKPYASGQLLDNILRRIPLSFYKEGVQCQISQKYREALELYEKALVGFHEHGLESDELSVLKQMAYVKGMLHEMGDSGRLYQRGLELARKIGNVSVQMDILNSMSEQNIVAGDLDQANKYVLSMDSLVEITSDFNAKFIYYNKKGKEARWQGAYKMAEQWYFKGMAIAESERRDAVSANRYLSYTNLRDLYASSKQYDDALTYARKALKEHQRLTPANDYKFYLPYMAIAEIYKLMGDKGNCFFCIDSLFLSAPNMEEPRELSMLYITRAKCHVAFNDYSAALADYKKADEILAVKYPQSDGDRIPLLPLMGGIEHKLKNFAESERLYRLYSEQMMNRYGENGMESINAQIYLANAEGFTGHIDAGCSDYTMAISRLKALMRKQLPYMSLQERENFWKPLSSLFTMMTPFAIEANKCQTTFTQSCYDALIMSKAFLLESERSLLDVVKKEGTDEDMQDYMRLSLMKNQIKIWEKDYEHNADSILDMSQRTDLLAARLAERCRSFSNITGFMDIDYNAVKQTMKPNDVLLDFADYVSETMGRKYAAYIINKEDTYPLVKYLFAERQIDSLGINRPDMYYDKDYAPEVLKLLWEPLKNHITEGATVYHTLSLRM